MNQKERMLAQLPYKAWLDGLSEERLAVRVKLWKYNGSDPRKSGKRKKIMRSVLGKAGDIFEIEPPFRCDYGSNIEVGNNFFANFNLTILDVAKVTIGENVKFGPNVTLSTAGHPVHPQSRNSGYEYGLEIHIGNNVWLGSNVVVNPGITIGENTVIGSGSIVTKDIPANVIAVGNPCRVLRKITEEDRKYYCKDRIFDVDDY